MARKKARALPRPEPEMYTVYGDIVQETEGAILLACNGDEVWLAKSQIEYAGERGDTDVEVTLPDWLADDQGLVDGQGYTKVFGDGEEQAAAPAKVTEFTPKGDGIRCQDCVNYNEDEHNVLDVCNECTRFGHTTGISDNFVPAASGPNATVELTLTIVEFSEDGETATVEDRHGNTADLATREFTHDAEEINVGDTLLCHVMSSAIEPTDLCPDTLEEADEDDSEPHDEPQDSNVPPACLRGRDVHWLKRETCTKAFPLSDEDKLKLGKEMADAQAKVDQLEDELASIRKSFKNRIEEHQEALSKAASEFRNGKTEPQDVLCDVYQDFDSGEVVFVTADEVAEEVMRRPMTTDERRPTLFDGPPDSKGHSAPLGEDPRHRIGTTEPTPQTWGHTCVDCAFMPNADDGTQADECADCAQSVEGGTDNWKPRRECSTCNYRSMAVNMPPCNTCTLNPQADASAEDDNWISAGNKPVETLATNEDPAEELHAGESIDEEAATEQPPHIDGDHQPASGAAIQ